ncbi:MAG TPA: septal ring lytic transglycosylase RlpA family protein [Acetobacteraceae bacterium]|nr:septal ring lytic transglycosylase RlpA family protein [Acetobacteraceae bacterium]
MRAASLTCFVLLLLAACAAPPQQAAAPAPCAQQGLASWYTREPGQTRMADGEPVDPAALTAAHRSLPFGTRVRVTDLSTGRSVVVRITDRGPTARNRIIDLSAAAARALDMRHDGVARVRVELLAGSTASPGAAAGTRACLLPKVTPS